MANRIDRFTLGIAALETGQVALQDTQGVTLLLGSKHDATSTRNCARQAGKKGLKELIHTGVWAVY